MFKKILWPIDVFETEYIDTDIEQLTYLHKKLGAKVQPVYVIMAGAIDIFAGPSSSKWMEAQREVARDRINKIIEKNKLNYCLPPQIIDNPNSSLRSAVTALQKFIAKEKIELVYIRSHARKGLERFFLGSFAETFLLHTKIPVWLSKPKQPFSIKTVLFSTDFSPACKKATAFANKLCSKIGANLNIFYKMAPSIDPGIAASAFGTGLYVPSQNFTQIQKKWEEKEMASALKKINPKLNPKALWGNQIQDVAETINLVQEKEKAGLIIMVAQASSLETYILGSTIRAVLRSCAPPLLILPTAKKRPDRNKKSSMKPGKSTSSKELFRRLY